MTMARHIQELEIKAYRGISNLKLEALNHINILTGDNNSGKTSVLEVLSSLNHPDYLETWTWILRENRESVLKNGYYNGFFNMFPVDDEEKKIGYRFRDGKDNIHEVLLEAKPEIAQIPEKEMLRMNGLMKTDSEEEGNRVIEAKCLSLDIYMDGKKERNYHLYDFMTRIPIRIVKELKYFQTVYVSPVDHANGTLLLDSFFSEPELYEGMLEILKEFDPNIISINALKGDGGTTPEYVILSREHKKALPLNVYGDGMKKVILILGALVKAKGGILLLDEFETAIHTSAMDQVFAWILKSAVKLDVQIFLTSHSKEAIDKVLRCSPDLQESINLYTLYKRDGRNLVRRMSGGEAIYAQEDLGLELR